MRYIERLYGVSGRNWRLTASRGDFLCRLEVDGRAVADIGGCALDGLPECDGLFEAWRAHGSADSRTGSIDSAAVLPFASDARVTRHIELDDGFASVTVDVKSRAMRRLDLETVFLPGKWTSVRTFDGAGFTQLSLAAGIELALPLAALTFESGDGRVFELGCGDDFWRYSAGAALGSLPAKLTVAPADNGVLIRRTVLELPPAPAPAPAADDQTAPATPVLPPRPWRFSWYFAWRTTPAATAGDGAKIAFAPAPGACLIAPASRRDLRKAVRAASGGVCWNNVRTRVCTDPAHLGRRGRGELAHWDFPELFTFKPWAERRAAENGTEFRMTFAADAPERALLAAAALETPSAGGVNVQKD